MSTNGVLCKVKKLSNILITQRSSCECLNKVMKTQWDISQVMGCNGKNLVKYGVLVLNRPILQKTDFMKTFWNNASVRITVDGGTCQWDNFLKLLPEKEQQSIQLPDLVTGDFDSITDEILQKYKKKGCKIIHTPDQDHTDFTKALMELNKYCTEYKTEIKHAVAIAQASGRIDQILGNVQTLYLAKLNLLPTTKVYIMSDDSISWLLFPGEHIIFIPEETRKHKRSWCSLVPMGEICDSVTTSGLKWNLENTRLKFGELVSTSNAFDGSEKVMVKCSHTILWSMKMPGILC
ncbi:PREDICTED: thiamin pyrophosphokinase 1 [Papilio xuthus]|uniref:Thiamin pyrophosphokinase 1 n=1 Tax=Papilio xuthus TaxID=66420 RepID=A0AAJ6Z3D9_PAPXU|nr:PREDICTED: thiamin pyrophosphokinase 1 [Papilio xuthus]